MNVDYLKSTKTRHATFNRTLEGEAATAIPAAEAGPVVPA